MSVPVMDVAPPAPVGAGDAFHPLETIAFSLAHDRRANLGVSEKMAKRNKEIEDILHNTAERLHAEMGLAGVQILGSGVQGNNHEESDLDIGLIAAPGTANDALKEIRGELDGITVDTPSNHFFNLADEFSTDVAKFSDRVRLSPWTQTLLFNDGIFSTDEQRLLRLAALAQLSKQRLETPVEHWYRIQNIHDRLHVGSHARIVKHLAERLPHTKAEVTGVITPELIAQRRARFGLPGRLAVHMEATNWLQYNQNNVGHLPAYTLYENILDRLENPANYPATQGVWRPYYYGSKNSCTS